MGREPMRSRNAAVQSAMSSGSSVNSPSGSPASDDDDVIEEAKPHRALGERMMPGRACDGERPFPPISAQRLLDGGDRRTRCRQDALPAAWPEKRIGVE